MTKATLFSLFVFAFSLPTGFLFGTAYENKKPVSAYQFYETSGFAHYELRGTL